METKILTEKLLYDIEKSVFFHFFKQTGSIQLNEAIYIESMWDSVTSGKDVAWGVIVH